MTKRSAAVFTAANNDAYFLPIWYRYYSRVFADCDIHVLDHNSSDGSIGSLRASTNCNIERLDHPYFGDFDWYMSTVEAKQRDLLKVYDTVLWVEPDELVWARSGLRRVIDELAADYVTCTGYEVIQGKKEASLDVTRPIFTQRHYWYRDNHYDKTLLSRVPLAWDCGFHRLRDVTTTPDPELFLIHLHRVDFRVARARHRMRISQRWPDVAREKGWGKHLRNTGGWWSFRRWYYQPFRRPTHRQSPVMKISPELRSELVNV